MILPQEEDTPSDPDNIETFLCITAIVDTQHQKYFSKKTNDRSTTRSHIAKKEFIDTRYSHVPCEKITKYSSMPHKHLALQLTFQLEFQSVNRSGNIVTCHYLCLIPYKYYHDSHLWKGYFKIFSLHIKHDTNYGSGDPIQFLLHIKVYETITFIYLRKYKNQGWI